MKIIFSWSGRRLGKAFTDLADPWQQQCLVVLVKLIVYHFRCIACVAALFDSCRGIWQHTWRTKRYFCIV
eukprot:scaffold200_cov173-Amphora_coffeaeformis.AAC.12